MTQTILKENIVTSIEGNKHKVLSDETYSALDSCFYDEDFLESKSYIYKCVFFFEFENTFCVNLWNESKQFETLEEMISYIDSIEL